VAISAERIRADIEAIARCTQTPGAGASRPTFSKAWAQAREYVIEQAKAAGCAVRIDAAGNVHARPKQLGWERKAWMSGSHVDSVPHGGDWDGVVGVVVPLELLRSAAEDGIAALPLELIIFAEEEGTTFGLGMIGSRAWVGELDAAELAELRNAEGQSYLEAGAGLGANSARLTGDRFNAKAYRGLVEVHIEQGPGMWRRNERVAVVGAIAGRRQMRVIIEGEANHAGATAMTDRRDALAGAGEIIVELEKLAGRLSSQTVATVGKIVNHPNAVNVIPDRVEFTIDFRGPDDAVLQRGAAEIERMIGEVCKRRQLKVNVDASEAIAARPMDRRLCENLGRAAEVAGLGRVPTTVSGALHDSAVMAPHLPTAMLFVPSRDGISHNPAEFSRAEDVAAAARVVEILVRRPALAELNGGSSKEFVAVVGGVFEHSPWIAETAWAKRPFSSVADLHEKMCAIVAAAPAAKQLELVRAHPDLVGRLAREGRVTRESNAEQSAAGLDRLNEQEITTFERNNAAYREKFGFPFVICARQNRKEAILAAFGPRLANSPGQELATALGEIYQIARLRLADAIWED
jgi:allantoate deiminase